MAGALSQHITTAVIQNGPSASLLFDQVNMIIYPVELSQSNFPEAWHGVT
tara:strand:- start:26595 stop:26744 length:150 start_codon:yes stop_codon:yes gene_type:complete